MIYDIYTNYIKTVYVLVSATYKRIVTLPSVKIRKIGHLFRSLKFALYD